jgi:hypothetical protein
MKRMPRKASYVQNGHFAMDSPKANIDGDSDSYLERNRFFPSSPFEATIKVGRGRRRMTGVQNEYLRAGGQDGRLPSCAPTRRPRASRGSKN